MISTRRCRICKQIKPLSDFYVYKSRSDSFKCKDCWLEYKHSYTANVTLDAYALDYQKKLFHNISILKSYAASLDIFAEDADMLINRGFARPGERFCSHCSRIVDKSEFAQFSCRKCKNDYAQIYYNRITKGQGCPERSLKCLTKSEKK